MKHVHFYLDESRNYQQVQTNILSEIQKHIPAGHYSSSAGRDTSPDTNNFTLFIRIAADILMSHGVADKNYLLLHDTDSNYYLNKFKHVLVPGPWLKRKLLDHPAITLDENHIHCVGWPRNDYLLHLAKEKHPFRRIFHGPAKRKLKVLWAPTHDFRKRGPENTSASTFPDFDRYTPLLSEQFDYSISLHPRNRKTKKPTARLLTEADVVISDFGTIVYEAWSLGKPVIFPRWIVQDKIITYTPGSAEAHIYENNLGYHPDSIEELIDIMESGPVIDDNVKRFMADYLPDEYRGNSAARVALLLQSLT